MYEFPDVVDAHDALWSALALRLTRAGLENVPPGLSRDMAFVDTWIHPRLLLGQACEYPLAKSYHPHVRIVATPAYTVPGCDGFRYCSMVVVRRNDPARSLRDLRDRRCVVNQLDSNSGMNLLRAAVAPLAGGRPFFQSVQISGSHRRSAEMVAAAEADAAALDCVSLAHLGRFDTHLVDQLRILARTQSSPCLPYITARGTDDATLMKLRAALAEIARDAALAPVRARLFLDGFDCNPQGDFAAVLDIERQALDLGYPSLV